MSKDPTEVTKLIAKHYAEALRVVHVFELPDGFSFTLVRHERTALCYALRNAHDLVRLLHIHPPCKKCPEPPKPPK